MKTNFKHVFILLLLTVGMNSLSAQTKASITFSDSLFQYVSKEKMAGNENNNDKYVKVTLIHYNHAQNAVVAKNTSSQFVKNTFSLLKTYTGRTH